MMKTYARVTGVAYIALGLLALIPALSQPPRRRPKMRLDVSYGHFLGLFPQNIVNKLAIIGFGVAGLLAARAERERLYARSVFSVMGLASILGLIPATATLFGYWPLWGPEAALHGANALLGGYVGFVAPRSEVVGSDHRGGSSRARSATRPPLAD